jgi:hypothetical protein
MRIRIVISGTVAGVIGQFILKYLLFTIRLGRDIPGWPDNGSSMVLPEWVDPALIGLALFVVFVSGWIAARWNWSRSWNSSFLSGAGSGLIAGALAYCMVGAFQAGVDGQAEILASLIRPVTETEGMAILLNSLTKTAVTTYLYLGTYLLGGTVAGALGGLASMLDRDDTWGKPVPPRDPWLFRLTGYGMTLNGFVNLIITIAVVQLLNETATKAVEENNLTGTISLPPVMILFISVMAGTLMICIPLGLTWGWLLRDWIVERKRSSLSALWFLLTVGFVGYWLVKTMTNILALGLAILPALGAILLFFGLVLVIGWNIKRTPEADWTPYRFADHLGYALTQGILGGLQIYTGIMAYSISISLIAITNIPHLFSTGDPVTQTLVDQVHLLYQTHIQLALGSMVASLVVGLIVSWIIGFIRWVFAKEKKPSVMQNKIAYQ